MGAALLNIIHIEPSTRCTLLCPQCPRTEYIDRISPEDCDIDITVKGCRGFDTIIMCGNHGDPIYHADFHGLISSLRADQPHVRFDIITNGAHRSTSWWETTARLLVPGDRITFSIDGMPHNNHQYRINSRWQSIEDAVIVLRKHGLPQLDLTWKWILFRYNEDEVQAGIDLAKQLGFNRFTLVDSIRNEPGETLTPTRSINSILEHVHA